MFKLLKRKERLDIKSIESENDLYNEWNKVSVKLSGSQKEFYVQKYLSSDDIDKIIIEYGKFMTNKSEEIGKLSRDDNNKLKIIMSILYCFLIRYKTDIMSKEPKTICTNITDEQMLSASLDIINLNIFSEILSNFDKSSLDVLRQKFDLILESAPTVAKNKEFIDIIKSKKSV